jgi:hypothetical protein
MRDAISGFAVSAAISAAAQLAIADRLGGGPCSTADLATACQCDEDFLRRLLRFLSTRGIFERLPNDRFAQTELSAWLRADAPGSLRPRAVFVGSWMSWGAWGKLAASIQSGRSAFKEAHNRELFDYGQASPEDFATFNNFMAQQTAASVAALLGAYDFTSITTLVDVGGGKGALVAGLLRANRAMRGTVFDLPNVVADAQTYVEAADLGGRFQVVGGDFFRAIPHGADCYILKFILHDWDEDACVRILKACRGAMPATGRLLIVEHLLPEDQRPTFAHFMDLQMLVMTDGGRERTRSEYAALAQRSDLVLRRTFPTEIGLEVIECTPV